MRLLLRVFRAASLAVGVLFVVLGLTSPLVPPVPESKGFGFLLFLVPLILLFPWACFLINAIGSGTRYSFSRQQQLMLFGVPAGLRTAYGLYGTLLLILLVDDKFIHWPGWLSIALERGVLGALFLALFFLVPACVYQTSLVIIQRGIVKRCQEGHAFSPFARRCPQCGLRYPLELVGL
ncbi:MAG: hypothetical protein LAO05_08530 [Acidobacteriia bacterium]|nr:hypothetical protein [Terriglobia bacterium]